MQRVYTLQLAIFVNIVFLSLFFANTYQLRWFLRLFQIEYSSSIISAGMYQAWHQRVILKLCLITMLANLVEAGLVHSRR